MRHWNQEVVNFVLVFPNDYRRALAELEKGDEEVKTKEEALAEEKTASASQSNGDVVAPDDEDAVAAAAARGTAVSFHPFVGDRAADMNK